MKIGGRRSRVMLVAAGVGAVLSTGDAFATRSKPTATVGQRQYHKQFASILQVSSDVTENEVDCGCETVETSFSGKPSDVAKSINHREAIARHSILSVRGEPVHIDQLVGEPSEGRTSIVVFLRSLG